MITPRWLAPVTGLVAGLAITTSLLGLFATWPYATETAAWRLQARAQDVGNLAAAGVLLAGLAGALKGSLRGLLVWAGALLYLAYAFFIYAMGMHFGPLFPAYVAVLGLAVHALVAGLPWQAGAVVAARPRTAGAVLLVVVAGGFGLLWTASIVAALLRGGVPPELAETGLAANPVHVLDLALVLPGMVLTARGARKGRPRAQLMLGAWLVFSTLMAATIGLTLALGEAWVPAVAVAVLALVAGVVAASVLATSSPGPDVALPGPDVALGIRT